MLAAPSTMTSVTARPFIEHQLAKLPLVYSMLLLGHAADQSQSQGA